jgi:hypothetical protein
MRRQNYFGYFKAHVGEAFLEEEDRRGKWQGLFLATSSATYLYQQATPPELEKVKLLAKSVGKVTIDGRLVGTCFIHKKKRARYVLFKITGISHPPQLYSQKGASLNHGVRIV